MKIAKKLLLSIMIIATVLFGSYSVVALAAEEIHPAGDVLTYTVLNKDEKLSKYLIVKATKRVLLFLLLLMVTQ